MLFRNRCPVQARILMTHGDRFSALTPVSIACRAGNKAAPGFDGKTAVEFKPAEFQPGAEVPMGRFPKSKLQHKSAAFSTSQRNSPQHCSLVNFRFSSYDVSFCDLTKGSLHKASFTASQQSPSAHSGLLNSDTRVDRGQVQPAVRMNFQGPQDHQEWTSTLGTRPRSLEA